MNTLLTNDDGCDAPGLLAAYKALARLGSVHVVAPKGERSACSHMITLRRPIRVELSTHNDLGTVYSVEGTPADCVRLGVAELVKEPIDLVVSGINRGANAGVDVFYSGTVAGAREGAILGITSIAFSAAIYPEGKIDWDAATEVVAWAAEELYRERLPGRGFWNVNLPTPIPNHPRDHVHRVPVATEPMPMRFERTEVDGGKIVEFGYGASYWTRDVPSPTDYSVLREGGIAVSGIPLTGIF